MLRSFEDETLAPGIGDADPGVDDEETGGLLTAKLSLATEVADDEDDTVAKLFFVPAACLIFAPLL